MKISEQCRAIEERAKLLHVDMSEVLKTAELHRATWDRWKAESHSPRLVNFQRVSEILDEIERKREHAA